MTQEFATQDINDPNSNYAKLRNSGKFERGIKNKLAECFTEIAAALNGNDVRQIWEALPYETREFGISEMLNAMANLGFEGKSIRMKVSQIDKRLLPCLFIADATGEPRVIFDQKQVAADESFGTVYFFRHFSVREQKNENLLRKSVGHGWFRIVMDRFRSMFIQIIGLGIFLNVVSLATPIFIMMVYDHVMGARSLDKVYMLSVGVGLAIAAEWQLRSLRARLLSWFSARIDYIVSNAVFSKLLHLPAALVEHSSIAGQVARLKTFESVRDFFIGPLFLVFIELPFTIVILGTIAIIAGWLALIPLAVGACYVMLIAFMRSRMTLAIHSSAKSASAKQQNYIETFEKLHSLRTNGMHEVWNEQFRNISGKCSLTAFRSNMLSSIVKTLSHAFALFAGLAVVYFGVSSVIAGEITAGALVATMMLVWRVLSPLQMLCGALPRMEQLKQSIIQIDRLMGVEGENSGIPGLKSGGLKGFITLNRVGLRYSKESDPVFSGLSFHIRPGELVTIAGANGAGKSTILKLINGLYRPQAGTVKIDGVDIRQMNPVELRKHIGYVSQTPEFFQGTIAENLRYAEPMATDIDIAEALSQVDALDEVNALPNGIHTEISSGMANQLSSSLAYRINLARAYIKNSPIMLMDELPYELLASKAGKIFKETILNWKGTKTMIVVTHRDDFITISDNVIILRGAEGILAGPPDQVFEQIKKIREQQYAGSKA